MTGSSCGPSATSVRDGIEELLGSPTRSSRSNARADPEGAGAAGQDRRVAFYEDSTRTRPRFETAAKRLSADTMTFSVGVVA